MSGVALDDVEPRARGRSRRAWAVLALVVLAGCAGFALVVLVLPRALPRLLAEDVGRWPRIARVDLELDLSKPPRFAARGRYVLEDVREREVAFLLNRSLELVTARTAGGGELAVRRGRRLRSPYHSEARVVRVDLGREAAAEGERVELELAWEGRGADGTEKRDWRGILLLAADELRFSEQTAALPLTPRDVASPGHEPTPGRVQVLLPQGLEAYVPGTPIEPSLAAPAGARAWAFELPEGADLGLVAGRYVREERVVDGVRLVALTKDANADLGPTLIAAAARASAFFAGLYGQVGGHALGVCEIESRGDSYNWAGYGLFTLESGALRNGVPHDKVGHEVAHLWFGQAVRARGEGERFLTEGLAEYASWRWIEDLEGADAARREAREARELWTRAVHERGEDPALARVGFTTDDYTVLAYRKGALAARAAEHALGREAFDAALARYVRDHAGTTATLDAFAEAIATGAARGDELVAWLAADGHAHLALADVAWDEGANRLGCRVVRAECPEDLDGPLPPAVVLRVSGAAGTSDHRVDLADGRVSIALAEEPAVLSLDPDATCAVAPSPPHVVRAARIVRSTPEDGARDVAYLLERTEIEFDRPLGPLGAKVVRDVRSAVYRAADAADLAYPAIEAVELDDGGRRLVLRHRSPLWPDRDHLLAFAGVLEDAYGAPVDVSLRFRTRASDDAVPPRVVACDPPDGAQGVDPALRTISITFSEPMSPGRGYKNHEVEALEGKGARFPLDAKSDSRWSEDERTLIYELGEALRPGTRYVLPMRALFRDLAGNALEPVDYAFTTRP